VHVAPTLGIMNAAFPCIRLFLGLEPMTPWLHSNSFTAVSGLPFPLLQLTLKGSLVHIGPVCVGSREKSDHFRSYVCSLSIYDESFVLNDSITGVLLFSYMNNKNKACMRTKWAFSVSLQITYYLSCE
jgi:hypothetical protein